PRASSRPQRPRRPPRRPRFLIRRPARTRRRPPLTSGSPLHTPLPEGHTAFTACRQRGEEPASSRSHEEGTMTRSRCSVFAAVRVLLASASVAWAASPTETVQTAIQRVFDESGTGKAKAASLDERRVQIRLAAESLFDFRDMARRSLGAH